MSQIRQAVTSAVTLPVKTANALLSEPLLTGPLLYILTRGPPHIRARILAPIPNFLAADPTRLKTLITVLKWSFALGLAKRVNAVLTAVALNNWHSVPWRKPGREFVWDGKTETVVLTGGASGFGFEMVKLLAGRARVVVLDRVEMPEELQRLPEVYFYHCDLTDFEAIESVSAQVKGRFGIISVLINNAGVANLGTGGSNSILETSTKPLEKIMRVNLMSHFVLIKEFVPGMLEAEKGHVVSICSMASFIAAAGLVDYCVTKVGALTLMDGLRSELLTKYSNKGGRTIQTTTVHPSWHTTNIIGGEEGARKLAQYGITSDPPVNVARLVVEQIMAGRSGRIYVPKTEETKVRQGRFLPIWAFDLRLGNVQLPWLRRKTLRLTDETLKSGN